MQCMVIVKATADSEAGMKPTEELLAAMGAYNEQLVEAGVLVAGEGLLPSSRGARVLFEGDERRVVDGPFDNVSDLVAGFWIFEVASLDEAIDWVKRCPAPMPADSVIEIRQIISADDFGDAMTRELRAQEDRLRAATAARQG